MSTNIQVFPKDPTPEPTPGSTRLGGGVGMDRKIEKPRFTPKRIGVGAAALLLVGLFGYALLADFGVRKLNVERDRLTISTVALGPFQEYIPVRGTVLPLHTVYLDALERGQVEQVFVEEGASVAEGDPLLRLANPDLELTVLQQEADLERSREALRNGRLTMEQDLLRSRKSLMEIEYQLAINKRNFERYESLSAEDLTAILSRQEYERLRDEYQYSVRRMALTRETQTQDSLLATSKVVQLISAVERMERNLEIVRGRLDNLTVRAPVAGQLTMLKAEVGESKGTGVRLGQIDMIDGFKVRAAIDEHYIGRVGRGQRGQFDSDDESYSLVIRRVYPEVREGRFEVDLVFEGEEPEGIRRGQTLHIRLELGDLDEAVQVARGGFYQATGGHWAYVLDAAGDRATRRSIALGRQNPRVYEVLEGLEPGEQVITSSYETFGEDMDVLVLR
ncbi:MAG: HlyD family efflux transporter periplasmic adaptor subunit [Gemmatimonadetes bacterium]|nr:HlyD family efflux transporter periplasmic adaptor subunit [Gemmatimonadota bacterium]MYB71968.1 HlyD family efflux transporter periplasmic adaptor subunit [Gemmatimonadota bacterium]